jgi:hypothetical protein
MIGWKDRNIGDRSRLRPAERRKPITDDVNPFDPRTVRCGSINISEATDKNYLLSV